MHNQRLLIIDDEPGIVALFEDICDDLDIPCASLHDPRGLTELYWSFSPSILIVDLNLPGFDGIMTLDLIYRLGCDADIYIVSGFDTRVLSSAREYGLSKGLNIRGIFNKPLDLVAVEKALLQSSQAERAAAPLPILTREISDEEILEALALQQFFPRYQAKFIFTQSPDDLDAPNTPHGPNTPHIPVNGLRPSPTQITGAEALVRWDHPRLGELAPHQFLPQLERMGKIGEMTDGLIRRAIVDMQTWAMQGITPVVAFNISSQMLVDTALPDHFERMFSKANIAPERIIFEVTESVAMTDTVISSEILTRFRLKGFGLSIDDFGTGFSSLVELYRMPFSELKIDRLFVSRALRDEEARTIVSVLILLAHGLGITVCAEGVEDLETLRFLATLRCDKGQGYLIAKPLLANDFKNLVLQEARALTASAAGRDGASFQGEWRGA